LLPPCRHRGFRRQATAWLGARDRDRRNIELEATERVLARCSKGTQLKQTASARTPATATKAAAPARRRGRPPTTPAKAAGGKRSSSNLGGQVLALATGETQQEIAAACKGARPNHVGAALPSCVRQVQQFDHGVG
jgi:hypothetical protein